MGTPSEPAAQVRAAEAAGEDSSRVVQTTIDGTDEDLTPKAKTPAEQDAWDVVGVWMTYRKTVGKPVAFDKGSPRNELFKRLLPFFQAGYTVDEVKRALNGLAEGIPANHQLQRALDTIRDKKTPGSNGRPIQQRGSGARVNDHWENRDDAVMAGAAAPAAPRADRIRTDNPAW